MRSKLVQRFDNRVLPIPKPLESLIVRTAVHSAACHTLPLNEDGKRDRRDAWKNVIWKFMIHISVIETRHLRPGVFLLTAHYRAAEFGRYKKLPGALWARST